ncbi:MAG: hypothetical protein GY801_26995, partial [bacterium]|nr:hypothetical protein [bacterium]
VRVLGVLTQKYDPTLYNTQKKKLDDAKSKLAHMQASLKDAIIASNQAPQDNYDGNDKAQLLELVRKTWGEVYPDDEILGIRFVMTEWDRTTAWRWAAVAEKWYKEDYSELHPYVVVKTSDTIATTYFAYMVKDHMKGDKVKLTLDDKSSTSPEWQMLMTNWK